MFKRMLVVFVLSIASNMAFAGQPAATQPSQSSPATNAHPRDGDVHPLAPGAHPTDEQIQQAEKFLNDNSPNRYLTYQRFKALVDAGRVRPERLAQFQQSMYRGYQELKALERQEPDLYQMKMDELKLEDQITGLVIDARQTQRLDGPDHRQALRDKMRPLFQDLLKKRAEETNYRITKIKNALESQKQELADLQTADDDTVDKWMDKEIDTQGRFSLGFAGVIPLKHLPKAAQDHHPGPTTDSVNADVVHH